MRSFSVSSFAQDLHIKRMETLHPEMLTERAERRLAIEARDREQDGLALPTLQQAALLMMHESHVKRTVLAKLLDGWNDKPSAVDFHTLVERGLCIRNIGKRLHDLTPAGIIAAHKVERALCNRYDIHLLIEIGQVGWQQKYQCTCGKEYYVRRSPTAPANARAQWAREHATQDGMTRLAAALKPPVTTVGERR